jgi:hypothetical protein
MIEVMIGRKRAVPGMSTKFLWRLWLGLIIIATLGGCSAFGSDANGNNAAAGAAGPAFSLMAGDNELAGNSGRQLSEAYKPGITLIELLKSSGVVTFAEDGFSILAVNKIFLAPDMIWQIQLGGKIITDWNSPVSREQAIVITAKPAAGDAPLLPIILTVNGGSEQPELTHSHILSYSEDLSVRGLLKSSGIVQLAEDNKTVITVMGYTPLTSEDWKLKVNDKTLLDSGIDMKLRPQDVLEISLVLR